MKAGDKVVMLKDTMPNSSFRTGIVKEVSYNAVRVKRDDYKGHEYTWWDRTEWKVVKPLKSDLQSGRWPFLP